MRHEDVPYDEAIWAVDEAIARVAAADPVGATGLLSGALAMLDRAPYPALVRDARRFGSDAADGLRDGDPERAADFLVLLRHVTEDMGRLDATTILAA
ncbi:hypothetical protein ACFQE8_13005 [Salinirubellus sp. GCM10025818]|uniref:hypothetical protein n=1 Tax=Salinirubellus TaxID=2162630 RepID=UPI0030D288A5